MKWGSVTPAKTEKSLSQEPLVVIIHLVNLSMRNGYGSTLPNMNGIEFPDPKGESELLQRLGIATDMCYTILESPEQASNTEFR